MKKAYPVILSQGEKFIVVYIPDFEINTQGENIAEAIEMARDAIGVVGIEKMMGNLYQSQLSFLR